jgi:hypothetical protein
VGARAALGVGCWLVLVLRPGEALAVTISAAGVDQATSAQLGAGVVNGSECVDSPSCQDSQTNTGPVPLTVPMWNGSYSEVRAGAGTLALDASAEASVALYEPDEFSLMLYPDLVVIGQLRATTTIRDSAATGFHSSAASSASSDDFLQFEVPALLAGESFLMDVFFNAFSDDFTTLFAGSLGVEDVTSGLLLASFDPSGSGSVQLDLSGLSGHDVRVWLQAELAMAGDEGFGGGADPLTERSFSSFLTGDVFVSHVVVPEPAPGLLIAAGLAVLALRSRGR